MDQPVENPLHSKLVSISNNNTNTTSESYHLLDLYISPNWTCAEQFTKSQAVDADLLTNLQQQINTNRSICSYVILGDSGSGKTSLALNLWNLLWNELKTSELSESWTIPFYIYLPEYSQKLNVLILSIFGATEFKEINNSSATAKKLRFILLLDAFEELPDPINIYNENSKGLLLNHELICVTFVNSNCPINNSAGLINYFKPDSLSDENNSFRMYYIEPFTPEQIDSYISNFRSAIMSTIINSDSNPSNSIKADLIFMVQSKVNGTRWIEDDQEYLFWFHQKQLRDLASTPYILFLILCTLPQIILDHSPDNEGEGDRRIGLRHSFVRVKIYDEFTKYWFKYQATKLMNSGNTPEYIKGMRQSTIESLLRTYCENLASFAIEKNGILHYNLFTSNETLQARLWQWQSTTDDIDLRQDLSTLDPTNQLSKNKSMVTSLLELLRRGSLLTSTTVAKLNTFSFIHASLLDYFASSKLTRLHFNAEAGESHAFAKYLKSTVLKDRNILRFLGERVKIDPQFTSLVVETVFKSRVASSVQSMASNAMSILNYGDYSFSYQDFSDVQIQGSDLNGAICANTNFKGANLSNVDFTNAFLCGAQFQRSILANARFGDCNTRVLPKKCPVGIINMSDVKNRNVECYIVICKDGTLFKIHSSDLKVVNTSKHARQTFNDPAYMTELDLAADMVAPKLVEWNLQPFLNNSILTCCKLRKVVTIWSISSLRQKKTWEIPVELERVDISTIGLNSDLLVTLIDWPAPPSDIPKYKRHDEKFIQQVIIWKWELEDPIKLYDIQFGLEGSSQFSSVCLEDDFLAIRSACQIHVYPYNYNNQNQAIITKSNSSSSKSAEVIPLIITTIDQSKITYYTRNLTTNTFNGSTILCWSEFQMNSQQGKGANTRIFYIKNFITLHKVELKAEGCSLNGSCSLKLSPMNSMLGATFNKAIVIWDVNHSVPIFHLELTDKVLRNGNKLVLTFGRLQHSFSYVYEDAYNAIRRSFTKEQAATSKSKHGVTKVDIINKTKEDPRNFRDEGMISKVLVSGNRVATVFGRNFISIYQYDNGNSGGCIGLPGNLTTLVTDTEIDGGILAIHFVSNGNLACITRSGFLHQLSGHTAEIIQSTSFMPEGFPRPLIPDLNQALVSVDGHEVPSRWRIVIKRVDSPFTYELWTYTENVEQESSSSTSSQLNLVCYLCEPTLTGDEVRMLAGYRKFRYNLLDSCDDHILDKNGHWLAYGRAGASMYEGIVWDMTDGALTRIRNKYPPTLWPVAVHKSFEELWIDRVLNYECALIYTTSALLVESWKLGTDAEFRLDPVRHGEPSCRICVENIKIVGGDNASTTSWLIAGCKDGTVIIWEILEEKTCPETSVGTKKIARNILLSFTLWFAIWDIKVISFGDRIYLFAAGLRKNLCCVEIYAADSNSNAHLWKILWTKVKSPELLCNSCNVTKAIQIPEESAIERNPNVIGKSSQVGGNYQPKCKLFEPIVQQTALIYGSVAPTIVQSKKASAEVLISKDNWILSIIRKISKDKGGSIKATDRQSGDNNHVFILLEGILNYYRFFIRADLYYSKSHQEVYHCIRPYNPRNLYQRRRGKDGQIVQLKPEQVVLEGEQWDITNHDGMRLIDLIMQDKELFFDYTMYRNNCIKWAIDTVAKIGITVEEKWYNSFMTLPRNVGRRKLMLNQEVI